MKNLSLILNIVLLVAVIVLFVLQFSAPKVANNSVAGNSTGVAEVAKTKIAYVLIDSVLMNYDLYLELRDQFTQNQQRMEANLSSKSRALESKAADFQQKMEQRLITMRQAEEMQKQLMQEQENLMGLRDNLSQKLMMDEQVMNKQVYDSISSFLRYFNRDGKFDMILSSTVGGSVLQADSTLDITSAVIKGVNARYAGQKDEE